MHFISPYISIAANNSKIDKNITIKYQKDEEHYAMLLGETEISEFDSEEAILAYIKLSLKHLFARRIDCVYISLNTLCFRKDKAIKTTKFVKHFDMRYEESFWSSLFASGQENDDDGYEGRIENIPKIIETVAELLKIIKGGAIMAKDPASKISIPDFITKW